MGGPLLLVTLLVLLLGGLSAGSRDESLVAGAASRVIDPALRGDSAGLPLFAETSTSIVAPANAASLLGSHTSGVAVATEACHLTSLVERRLRGSSGEGKSSGTSAAAQQG